MEELFQAPGNSLHMSSQNTFHNTYNQALTHAEKHLLDLLISNIATTLSYYQLSLSIYDFETPPHKIRALKFNFLSANQYPREKLSYFIFQNYIGLMCRAQVA